MCTQSKLASVITFVNESSNWRDLRDRTELQSMFPAEHKLHANTQHSIKRREPGILKLITTYNSLCSQLQSLIQWRRAPPSAVPPHIILRDGVFQLNVDDTWQDVGLDDDTLNPPAWLLDDTVRNGIQLHLEVDWCNEEEARLMRERAVKSGC
ncbi:hypothetical protein BDR03DRAFT_980513 [Suillus americanus]|nr:hypothetical protein BDR03DRAFT_980513 [Suillus americanus]